MRITSQEKNSIREGPGRPSIYQFQKLVDNYPKYKGLTVFCFGEDNKRITRSVSTSLNGWKKRHGHDFPTCVRNHKNGEIQIWRLD